MTDTNGAAALEKLLARLDHHATGPDVRCSTPEFHRDRALAILANGAVFLPDGREVERPLTLERLRSVVIAVCDANEWGIYRTGHGTASWVDRNTLARAIFDALEGGSE
jgi:hypothetical protein